MKGSPAERKRRKENNRRKGPGGREELKVLWEVSVLCSARGGLSMLTEGTEAWNDSCRMQLWCRCHSSYLETMWQQSQHTGVGRRAWGLADVAE